MNSQIKSTIFCFQIEEKTEYLLIAILVNRNRTDILRIVLQEQRRQTALLVRSYDSKIQSLLKQRDDEISRAGRRKMELEECVRRMEMENVTWQRVTQESEAMAVLLRARMKEAAAEDATKIAFLFAVRSVIETVWSSSEASR